MPPIPSALVPFGAALRPDRSFDGGTAGPDDRGHEPGAVEGSFTETLGVAMRRSQAGPDAAEGDRFSGRAEVTVAPRPSAGRGPSRARGLTVDDPVEPKDPGVAQTAPGAAVTPPVQLPLADATAGSTTTDGTQAAAVAPIAGTAPPAAIPVPDTGPATTAPANPAAPGSLGARPVPAGALLATSALATAAAPGRPGLAAAPAAPATPARPATPDATASAATAGRTAPLQASGAGSGEATTRSMQAPAAPAAAAATPATPARAATKTQAAAPAPATPASPATSADPGSPTVPASPATTTPPANPATLPPQLSSPPRAVTASGSNDTAGAGSGSADTPDGAPSQGTTLQGPVAPATPGTRDGAADPRNRSRDGRGPSDDLTAGPVVTGQSQRLETVASMGRHPGGLAAEETRGADGQNPIATEAAVGDIQRLLDRVVQQIRTVAGSRDPALEASLNDPELGTIRLLVAGRVGEVVRAELVVVDQRIAEALARAVDRSATSHGLSGIDLRIRTEPARSDAGATGSGTTSDGGQPDAGQHGWTGLGGGFGRGLDQGRNDAGGRPPAARGLPANQPIPSNTAIRRRGQPAGSLDIRA